MLIAPHLDLVPDIENRIAQLLDSAMLCPTEDLDKILLKIRNYSKFIEAIDGEYSLDFIDNRQGDAGLVSLYQ